ncbi:MAG: hypothetical protein PHY02_01485 [Phycisphaerae bacterium]|nr:hypothetical protein [Phycisphaerae bacterium]
MTSSGTLTKTEDCCNEHEAIHLVSLVLLEKVDDVNDGDCVGPGDEINYRIDYNYPAGPNLLDINDVNIIDELPGEVEPNNPSDPNYNSGDHTYTWHIGTIHPGNTGYVTLKVNVKPCVDAGIIVTNECEIRSGEETLKIAYEDTPVCCNCIVVEDFDSYMQTGGTGSGYPNDLLNTWYDHDYDSGADVSLETATIRSGQSMKYVFQNVGYYGYYSEVDVNTLELPSGVGTDWTVGGVEALTLYFYGKTDNDANEPMYVRLADGDSNAMITYGYYGEDINDLKDPNWHEWNIDLADFVGVDQNNIKRMTIGFGDKTGLDIEGAVYFDDIRLYPPRCFQRPTADLTGDCKVNYRDMEVLADWALNVFCAGGAGQIASLFSQSRIFLCAFRRAVLVFGF